MKTKTKTFFTYLFCTVITFAVITFLFMGISEARRPVQVKNAVLHLNGINVDREYLSSIYKPDFNFNMIGFKWQGEAKLYVRVYKEEWSEWYLAEEMEPGRKKEETWQFSDPLFFDQSDYFQFKVLGNSRVDLEITALNTKKEENIAFLTSFFKNLIAKADDIDLDIISRSGWEADESWRLDEDDEIWEPEYEQVTKIIVHHTAGSDGGDDPTAVIRGIYYWHAVGREWGDIGYNYLIDTEGNIYEGRYGGDGVIGAHAYNEIDDLSYNRGTMGVAILGNYQTTDILTTASRNSLTDIMAVESQLFGFEPSGSSLFHNENIPNIVGHRDVDATFCPGDNIHNQLDDIIEKTQDKYENLEPLATPKKAASFSDQSASSLEIKTGDEQTVWVDFKNNGNTTWRSYIEDTLKITVSGSSNVQASDWVSDEVVTTLETANVDPGEVGRFRFKLKAPSDVIRLDQIFLLKWGDDTLSSVSFHIEVTGLEYAANNFNHNILPATFPGTLRNISVTYKNIGLNSWAKENVYLEIKNENDSQSEYYSSWPDSLGWIRVSESEVTSQETATFTFQMKSPSVAHYRTFFRLYRENGDLIPGSIHSLQTRVDSTYQAQIQEHNIPVAMLNSWHVPVTLKFKNTGLMTWDKNVVLNIYDGDWRNSAFSHQSWPSDWGNFNFQESVVRPGETATFRLTLFPPFKAGTYYTIFKLEYKGRPDIAIQGDWPRLMRVDESGLLLDTGYQAEFQSVSAPPALLQLQRLTTEVKIKNTGTVTWGSDVVLNIYDADWRETYFRDATWGAFEGGIHAQQEYVRPGETATFRFIYRAPWKTGLYRNRFRLAIEGREYLIIPGSEDSALTRVDPR